MNVEYPTIDAGARHNSWNVPLRFNGMRVACRAIASQSLPVIALAIGIGLSLGSNCMADVKTFGIGNSLTNTFNQFGNLTALSVSAHPGNGIAFNYQIRSNTSLASIVSDEFNPGDFVNIGTFSQAFANNAFDVLMLQPYPGYSLSTIRQEVDAAKTLVQSLRQNPANANTRVLIYATWPRDSAKDPLSLPYVDAWSASDGNLDTVLAPSEEAFDFFMNEFRLTVPEAEIIPVGHVFNEIALQTSTPPGIPGLSSLSYLYSDPIHVNNAGAYTAAATVYSVIYGESPVGLGYPSAFSQPVLGNLMPAESLLPVQTIIQNVTSSFAAVPEGNSLVGVGLAMVALLRRRRGK